MSFLDYPLRDGITLPQEVLTVVSREVTQAFQGINALWERWKDLLETSNTATNEEFKWTANELKNGLKGIEFDINDLEETINILFSCAFMRVRA